MYAEISYLLRNNRSVDFLRSKTPLSTITNIQANQTNSLLASKPVRLCFCKEGVQNCSFQPPAFHVKKGHSFKVQAVAVDHVNNPVSSAIIHSDPSSDRAGLSTGQQSQKTVESCTDLTCNLYSANDSEQIHLYAEGPKLMILLYFPVSKFVHKKMMKRERLCQLLTCTKYYALGK